MNAKELLILNFQEVRRRSIRLWKDIPADCLHWRPDTDNMSCIEIVRHVLESENTYHHLVLNRGRMGDFKSPLADAPLGTVEDELRLAQPYRERFLQMVNGFTAAELEEVYIDRPSLNLHCQLGDYLMRIAYHESVQYGQLLGFLLTAQPQQQLAWD
jgi:hypothetical protein